MEALKRLLDEIEMAFRRGDVVDWEHGLGVLDQGMAMLSQETNPRVRLDRALGALRVLRDVHKRNGRTELAAEAAAKIAKCEDGLKKLARAAERELERRELGPH